MELLRKVISSSSLYAFAIGCAISTPIVVFRVVWTVLKQVLFKKSNEPPFVFYWVPILGSAVSYVMDPSGFFASCQKKVRSKS